MTNGGEQQPTALVISDDLELGGLLALNLRQRQLAVEQTEIQLVASPRWFPANGRPRIIVVNAERTTTDLLATVRTVRARPELADVPMIVAAYNAADVVAKLATGPPLWTTRPDDVPAIMRATLRCLAGQLPDRPEGETSRA
jgi:DNA-binding response OmpR family regulator